MDGSLWHWVVVGLMFGSGFAVADRVVTAVVQLIAGARKG